MICGMVFQPYSYPDFSRDFTKFIFAATAAGEQCSEADGGQQGKGAHAFLRGGEGTACVVPPGTPPVRLAGS